MEDLSKPAGATGLTFGEPGSSSLDERRPEEVERKPEDSDSSVLIVIDDQFPYDFALPESQKTGWLLVISAQNSRAERRRVLTFDTILWKL